MPDWFRRLQADISQLWSQLSTGQKWLVGGVSTALIAGLLGVSAAIYFVPGGELLAGDLNQQEVGEVTRFLEAQGARYRVSNNAVYVYGDSQKLRGEFALGSSQKTLGGWNILKSYNWSQTAPQFNETRLRALEEELSTTLEKGSDIIQWARVQLTERKAGLFPTQDTKPTAAVKVGARGELRRESVQGIQWLVANSLPGLKPSDVVVTDGTMRVLEGYLERSESEQITSEQRKVEEQLREQRVKNCARILDPIVGNTNYTLAAEVKVNYDKKAVKEKFTASDNPFEKRRKTDSSEEKNTEKAGAPGTPSNNPGDTIAQGQSSASGQSTASTQDTQEIDYEPGIVRETNTQIAPGDIEDQWVSIAVNYSYDKATAAYKPREETFLSNLEESLKKAVAHIDSSTHYYFALKQYPFDTSLEDQMVEREQWKAVRENVESAAFLIGALLSIVFFFLFLRKVFSVTHAVEETEMVEETVVPQPSKQTMRELGLRMIGDLDSLPPEEQKSRMIREQVEDYAKSNAEEVANILRNWISE
jgi:flagellar biosynthesis/type III secretory pathway M-ring protein FliF/YscJ